MVFAEVILPLAVPKLYTYRIPEELKEKICPGQRVVVQFGGRPAREGGKEKSGGKLYSALVKNIHPDPPKNYSPKDIEYILDEKPIINEKQFALWDWMSEYYLCSAGEVMNAALPSGLKLSSETNLVLNPDFGTDYSILSDEEFLLAEALETSTTLSIQDACEILGKKKIYPVIKSMFGKKAIIIQEELKEKYKPKFEQYVKLSGNLGDDEPSLKKVFDELGNAPKQLELLMVYVQLSRVFTDKVLEVKKTVLQKAAKTSPATLNSLLEKKVFELYEKEVGRISYGLVSKNDSFQLNHIQVTSLEKIKQGFSEKDVVLLHGVTSSGKTEIYIRLMEETLKKGKQVLYLLPEIALTTQIISRLSKHFGNRICVYHSRFNQSEKVEIWNMVARQGFPDEKENQTGSGEGSLQHPQTVAGNRLIVGARSALFLPFENLGLIIVDEEHENSFKQYDPAPRYNARDAALILARIHSAKTLLGSATPSLETYFNAKKGKFGLVEISERFGGIQMPEILIADIKEAGRKKIMKSHFSPLMMEEMQKAFNIKEQIILFQNRRGFAPFLQCDTCSTVPHCSRCDVKLTYHKRFSELRCHYCGYKIPHPKACMACGDVNLKIKGFGTEKIEEDISIFFPQAKIGRLDWDTTRSRNSYRQIIQDFEERQIDILIGTQMVTKGLDFDNVGLVGILNADNMLYFPDFRAHERSFQLMAQVAGRAGRKNKRGKVIIQTSTPAHRIIQDVMQNDYSSMYQGEINDRRNFNYPPFCRLIEITIKHKEQEKVNDAADFLAGQLRKKFGKRVMGPEFPLIARVKNQYLKKLLLKIEKEASVKKAKAILEEELIIFRNEGTFRQARVTLDVDPL